jgi:acetyl esterase/lipase
MIDRSRIIELFDETFGHAVSRGVGGGCKPGSKENETVRILPLTLCVSLSVISVHQPPCLAETDLAELAKAPAGRKHAYGAQPLQFGELNLPDRPGPHPVIILIHGGCWLSEYDIKHSRALANAFAKDGSAVWNLEYRRVGDAGGGWPGTFLDVAGGADHLRTLAKEYPLDLSRVIAVGHSAGGHLALWLAARHKLPASSDIYRAKPIEIAAVLPLAPASELDQLHEKAVCGNVVDRLIGGAPTALPERYHHATPSRWAPIGVPQTVIVGKQDSAWGWVGKAYVEAVRAAGDEQVRLITVPQAGHFEVIDPKSSAWPTVRDGVRHLLQKD